MFNSTNTPFTMPVMPATGGYADGAGYEVNGAESIDLGSAISDKK